MPSGCTRVKLAVGPHSTNSQAEHRCPPPPVPSNEATRPNLHLELSHCSVRDWRPSDARSLQRHADSYAVWRQLRDRFPHPYTRRDADVFLAGACGANPRTTFAIDVGGEAVGGIGLQLGEDVARASAEVGYWLGEEHWGRGIMTEVLRAVTEQAIHRFGIHRVYALPFAENAASARVLEKAGFTSEGRLRRSAVKDGRVLDQLVYAITDLDLSS